MSDRGQWYTLSVMLILSGSLIAWDAFAWQTWGVHATVSRTWLRAHQAVPVVSLVAVFALGVLVGHLFLPQYGGR